MSIRRKLFLIITSIFLMIGFILIIYYFILALPSKKIAEEQALLEQLKFRLVNFQKEMNRIGLITFDIQSPRNDNENKLLNETFDKVANISYIRKLNKQIKDALIIISERKTFIEIINNDVLEFYNEIKTNLVEIFNSEAISLSQINSEEIEEKDKETINLVQFKIKQLNTKLLALNNIIDDSAEILEKQRTIIDKEIEKIKFINLILTVIIISISIIINFIITINFSNSLAGRISIIEKNISSLKNGDLRIKMNLKSNDEITRLGNDFNEFIDYLTLAINDIKISSKKNIDSSYEMITETGKTADLLDKINQSIDSIKEKANVLFDQVKISVDSVSNIISKIESFFDKIKNQITMVEETTTSVTKMISLLNNMKNIIANDKELTNGLVKASESGRIFFNSTYEKIEQITKFVTNINEMIKMINDIAARTNILAINASIESAHAGESGKGFTVVSQEIRKLAEASTNNAKSISISIKDIISLIQSTKNESNNMYNSFNEIENKIKDVFLSINDINSAVIEMNESNSQIKTVISKLQNTSITINDDTNTMNKDSQAIKNSMKLLNKVTDDLITGITSIVEMMNEISNISNNFINVGGNLKTIGITLEQRISKFKTE